MRIMEDKNAVLRWSGGHTAKSKVPGSGEITVSRAAQ